MKKEIRSLLQFLKKPTLGFDPNGKVKRFFKILLLDVVLTGIMLVVITLLDQIEVIHNNLHHKANEINSIVLVISAIIFAPVLEEFVFRYFLVNKRFNPLRIFIRKNKKTSNEYEYTDDEVDEEARNWNRILPKVFYIFATLFGLVHIHNYEINIVSLLLMPILICTPFILGLLAGYLRVKVNFGAAVGLHVIHNLIFLGIGVLSGEFIAEKDYNDISNIIQQMTKDGVTRKELLLTTSEYSLEIKINREYDGTINESRILYDSVLYSPTLYNVENIRMKDLYRDMKKFYRDSMLFTNPAFLGEYDGELRVDIRFKRSNSTRIHSLDTVIRGIKEIMTEDRRITM